MYMIFNRANCFPRGITRIEFRLGQISIEGALFMKVERVKEQDRSSSSFSRVIDRST